MHVNGTQVLCVSCLRDPSKYIILTLGPKVYQLISQYHLLWAIWIPRDVQCNGLLLTGGCFDNNWAEG